MKKFLIPIVSVIAGIIIPVAGMTITPTRDLILGLAPDEAVLQLADKIDSNRVENEAKLAEFQSTITAQQAKIAEQEQLIANQGSQISDVQSENQETQVKVNNEAECRKLYSANPECTISNKIYRTKAAFDDFISDTKKRIEQNNTDEDIDAYKKTWSVCQNIIAKCG